MTRKVTRASRLGSKNRTIFTKDGGKTDTYRKVDKDKFNDNWDRIFGKSEEPKIEAENISES